MKLGRLIIAHREDLINPLKDFYLGERTNFLVIAYNASTVDPEKFTVAENFRLVPYSYAVDGKVTASGRQHRVWIDVAKKFSDIEGWVAHDYDCAVKPSDADLFSRLDANSYAMIGTAFPVWQEGMRSTEIDTYPFPEGHRYISHHPNDVIVRKTLTETFPVHFQGIKTLVKGYSDFVAVSRDNILLLDDEKIRDHDLLGVEQVPHTVWRARGIKPVDMRKFYTTRVLLDVAYVSLNEPYDFLHPVKFWPGAIKPGIRGAVRNWKLKLKKVAKRLIGYKEWQWR